MSKITYVQTSRIPQSDAMYADRDDIVFTLELEEDENLLIARQAIEECNLSDIAKQVLLARIDEVVQDANWLTWLKAQKKIIRTEVKNT